MDRLRDWWAARSERQASTTQPTTPPEPELTPEEEAVRREQLAGGAVEGDAGDEPAEPGTHA